MVFIIILVIVFIFFILIGFFLFVFKYKGLVSDYFNGKVFNNIDGVKVKGFKDVFFMLI